MGWISGSEEGLRDKSRVKVRRQSILPQPVLGATRLGSLHWQKPQHLLTPEHQVWSRPHMRSHITNYPSSHHLVRSPSSLDLRLILWGQTPLCGQGCLIAPPPTPRPGHPQGLQRGSERPDLWQSQLPISSSQHYRHPPPNSIIRSQYIWGEDKMLGFVTLMTRGSFELARS